MNCIKIEKLEECSEKCNGFGFHWNFRKKCLILSIKCTDNKGNVRHHDYEYEFGTDDFWRYYELLIKFNNIPNEMPIDREATLHQLLERASLYR